MFDLAQKIIENSRQITFSTSSETDRSDQTWMRRGEAMFRLFGSNDADEWAGGLKDLSQEVQRITRAQPIAVNVPKPCKVFGDSHGQLRDILLLFREFGFPSNRGGDIDAVTYVFNGDFVDRGYHQVGGGR